MQQAKLDQPINRLRKIHADPGVASVLQSHDYTSALKIASTAPSTFVDTVAPSLGGNRALARQIHDRSTQIRSSVIHAWANARTAIVSPHYTNLRVSNVSPEIQTQFEQIPNYEEMFGTLDYCSCEECRSIFGAAAYLVDLLRIIDTYVTVPNTTGANPTPYRYLFSTRRADIGNIALTCANTNDTFPMLRVVNERLSALAGTYLGTTGDDPLYEKLTALTYPFNLPFNLQAERIPLTLSQAGVALADLFATFDAADAEVAQAGFDLSPQQWAFVTTSLAGDDADLAASWGVATSDLAGLSDAAAFRTATGLDTVGLMSLLAQGLSAAEIAQGVAAGFFINAGLSGRWLAYAPGDENTPPSISGMGNTPNDPLDRLSRFLRVAAELGWDYGALDWALRIVGATPQQIASGQIPAAEISAASLAALGRADRLAAQAGLDLTTFLTLIGPIKPYGASDESVSTAPFDMMFNAAGSAPYHPTTPLNPGYKTTPSPWTIGSSTTTDQAQAAFVAAGLGIPQATLIALANALWGSGTAITLTLENLSALNRHALLLAASGVTADLYVKLADRAGLIASGKLQPVLSLGQVETWLGQLAWLSGSGLSVDEIDYILGGDASPAVDPLFQSSALADWLPAVAQATSGLVPAANTDAGRKALDEALFGQLAGLFGVPTDLIAAAHPLALAGAPLPEDGPASWEAAFTTPPAGSDAPPPYLDYATAYVTALSRWLVLAGAWSLPASLLTSVARNPVAYGMPASLSPTLDALISLSAFQTLVSRYGDTAGRFQAFVDPQGDNPDLTALLVAATGWDSARTAALLMPLASVTNRVSVASKLDAQTAMLARIGGDASLPGLLIAALKDATTPWEDLTAIADRLLGAVKGRIGAGQWPAIGLRLDGLIAERQRAVLAGYVLAKLRAEIPTITTLRNLSEYMLIDVEVSGVLQISYIREALNAAQLYLQRCRLRLEPIRQLEIPEIWWEWLTDYRVWEANREVFLYPENYIDPTLRKSATPLFQDLQNQLLQNEVTTGNVETDYRKYLDGLISLAGLEYVDAYHCTVDDPERGPIDTSFYFARSSTDPYSFSMISFDTDVWSAWTPIDVTIPVAVITPVYVFKRLYIFWVELKRTKDSAAAATAATPQSITYKATIKCTFPDSNGKWIQPQAVVEDEVVYFMTSASDQTSALGPWDMRGDLFQMDDLFWNKVSLTVVNPGGDPANQRLVLAYGPLFVRDLTKGMLTPPEVPAALSNASSSDLMFAERIFALTNSYNELMMTNADAYMPVVGSIVLDRELNPSFLRRPSELVIFERDSRENAPPLFRPELETLIGSLMLTTSDCAYSDAYRGDFTPPVGTVRPPAPVTAASFQTSTINAATSQSIFNDLVGHNVVVNVVGGAGKVSAGFGADSDLSFLFGGTPTAQTDPFIPQVRAILLDLAGDPTLFGYVPVTTSRTLSVKNQPGSFLFATGDETFLITPSDTRYTQITDSTIVTEPVAAPSVFPEFFKPVSATNYQSIYNDLVGQNVLKPSGNHATLDPLFSAETDLSFLFAGAPLAQQAMMINQVRRILLALPTLTMLSYQGNNLPRFVQPTSFISNDINAAGSQSIYEDLQGYNVIDEHGFLIGDFNEASDLSFLFGGNPQPALEAEVRAILLLLPKFVQANSFVSTDAAAPISEADSQAAFTTLVQKGVLDAQGLVAISYGPTTDLSYLFPDASQPQRGLMIASATSVLQRFYACTYRTDVNAMRFNAQRVSARTSAHELNYVLRGGGIDALLSLDTQNAPIVPKAPFSRFQPASAPTLAPPALFDAAQIDFDGPYGLYYWELFFHTPMLVSGALAANQQFSDAKKWLEYILDPTVAETFVQATSLVTPDIDSDDAQAAYQSLLSGGLLEDAGNGNARVTSAYSGVASLPDLFPHQADPAQHALMMREVANVLDNFQVATPPSHYWQFRPFRNYTLESLVAILTDPAQIATYNDDPFDPHAIARLRIGAYEKTILMKYVDVLTAWGDMLFTEFTWESITSATLLYMYAYDLLGPRPENLGPCATPNPLSYNQIKALNPDGIPQFLIGIEDMLPPPSGSAYPVEGQPFNAIDAYFGVPENDKLIGYWDLVEDRLGKIRNGLNIKGVPQTLALWDPPIDPMALVRAAASGGGALSIEGAAGAAQISDYRFVQLHGQATELASMVTALGGALLAALEKQDADALDTLRNTQETLILSMTTGMKQKAIDELNATITNLTSARDKAQFQADYYTGLHNGGLNSHEVATRVLQAEAIYFSAFSGPIHGISIIGYLSPSIFGLADGGMQWGEAVNTGASIADSIANTLNFAGAMTTSMGEFARRDDDWQFQAQLAQKDVTAYDSQITAAQAQLAAAQLDLTLNQRSIEQSQAVGQFLKSKFTNTQLYQWMVGRISALYFQAYTMALDAARKAELAFQYELNASDTFISFDYWNSLYKGLMAGETLSFSLAQMKKAYTDQRTRTLQIEKSVSLLQLDPVQVLNLQSGQPASFSLTETMFDLDYPGHYQRQIASVSLTIPALVGPYQNVSATLIQESSNVAVNADPKIVDYLVKCDQGSPPAQIPSGLRQSWKATQEIALSRGTSDSGTFELNFGSDLFMPFEGTGAVSTWTLAIPPENNRIDLGTITDVILDIRYTALDGGSTFDGTPSFRTSVNDTLRQNKVRYTDKLYLDAASMLASSWYAFLNPEPGAATQALSFGVTPAMFPYLPTIQLDQVSVRLVVANGVTIPDGNDFATLAIGKLSDPLVFASAGTPPAGAPGLYVAIDPRTKIAGSAFLAPWTLTFTVADLPAALVKGGAIDPAALLGVEFLLSYSADVLPPKKS